MSRKRKRVQVTESKTIDTKSDSEPQPLQATEAQPSKQSNNSLLDAALSLEHRPVKELLHLKAKQRVHANTQNETAQNKNEATNDDNNPSKDKDQTEIVAKKRRQKPSLAELKSSVSDPSLIELCDVDAPEPFFLAKIKTSPGVWQVPSNWSSRPDAAFRGAWRDKYELQPHIRASGIATLRNPTALALESETNAESGSGNAISASSRDRVQPKVGSLDMDLRKMHAAFFHSKPDLHLSPLGAIYTENSRSRPVSAIEMLHFKHDEQSAKLLTALGISEGQPLPWDRNQVAKELQLPAAVKHWGTFLNL